MKKVISGRLYNTETARLTGYWESAGSTSDFSHTRGRAVSQAHRGIFSVWQRRPHEQILPQLREQRVVRRRGYHPSYLGSGRKWAEDHLDVEEYEELFGETCEDDGTEILSLVLAGYFGC